MRRINTTTTDNTQHESEATAIRRIMMGEKLTKFGPSMDKHLADKEKATFKAQGTIKMRKDGPDGIHGTTVNKNDTAKIAALKAKGYTRVSEDSADESLWDNIHKKRARIKAGSGEKMRKKGAKGAPTPDQMKRAQATSEEVGKNINITEDNVTLSPKLVQLLRMGLADKGELETVKRALKGGDKALNNPVLRKHLLELLNKLVDAIEDDSQIWVRLRKRLIKGEK